MKQQLVSPFIIMLLLASSVSIPAQIISLDTQESQSSGTATTIYVDDSNTQGPWNGTHEYPYQHITDGILHAADGDTVYVFNGIYNETFLVNKSITLRGQQQNQTIIDGGNNGTVVSIINARVLVRRFTIRNSGGFSGDAGVRITADDAAIAECTIFRTRVGVSIFNASQTSLTDSQFHTNGYGIFSIASDYLTIDRCTFLHNGIGVCLSDTHCSVLTNFYADTNGIGFFAENSSNIDITTSAARDNNDNEGGMFFESCSYINLDNCYLVHNGIGVNLINSSYCSIQNCNFSYNTHFACRLYQTLASIFLTNCVFTQNLRYAVHAEKSAFSVSWSNLIKDENFGLYAVSSEIDARYNWWGSITGPAHTGLTKADRGTLYPKAIRYSPWLTFPMPDVGPDWKLDIIFPKPTYTNPWPEKITFSEPDSDGDGAPDWWETKWGYNPYVWEDQMHLDPDNDSLTNIEECYMDQYGADPFHKDVFLELDWTKAIKPNVTNELPSSEITKLITIFADHNITLHIDTGELGGGEEIPAQSFISYADLVDLYWNYFLHGDMNNPRQYIFHYGLLCDYTEGSGFVFFGWNNLNSFVLGLQIMADSFPNYRRERVSVTSGMHELGHTFNLIASRFIGIDNAATMKPQYKEFWMYLPYVSLMSYTYTFSVLDYSDGTRGRRDFNDWGSLEFSFFKNTHLEYPIQG